MANLCKVCERKIKGEDLKELCSHCLRVKTNKEKLIVKQLAKESKPSALKKKVKELENKLKESKVKEEPKEETVKDETVKDEVEKKTKPKPKPKPVKK